MEASKSSTVGLGRGRAPQDEPYPILAAGGLGSRVASHPATQPRAVFVQHPFTHKLCPLVAKEHGSREASVP